MISLIASRLHNKPLNALFMKNIETVANNLRLAHATLFQQPILKIIDAIDQVATIFLNPIHPIRQEAERKMALFMIEDLFCQLTKPMLLRLLKEELNDPLILDQFCQTGGRLTRAYGPQLITHILPSNIPSIAVQSIVFALLVKSASIVKVGQTPQRLLSLFIQALHEVDSQLAQSIALIPWSDEAIETTQQAFSVSDLVMIYGSEQTVKVLRPLIPLKTKTIIYGPRVSFGVVTREKVTRKVAYAAALDIALYDQKGCLSPHTYYIEGPSDRSIVFSQWVAAGLEAIPLPKGPISIEEAAAIQQLRGSMPLKGGKVFASKGSVDWTVLYDPDPSFTFSPLSRTIFIKPIPDLLDLPRYIGPIQSHIQAIGIAASKSRATKLFEMIGALGASRICPIGKMQKPPLNWHHEGRFRILDLLRFVDWEK